MIYSDARVTRVKKKVFLSAYRLTGIIAAACRSAKISRACSAKWRQNDPAFLAKFEHAKLDAIDALEAHALARATCPDKPSDILCMFLLKSMDRPRFADYHRPEITVEHTSLMFRPVAGIDPRVVAGVADTAIPVSKVEQQRMLAEYSTPQLERQNDADVQLATVETQECPRSTGGNGSAGSR